MGFSSFEIYYSNTYFGLKKRRIEVFPLTLFTHSFFAVVNVIQATVSPLSRYNIFQFLFSGGDYGD
jgi:hypothetical protein